MKLKLPVYADGFNFIPTVNYSSILPLRNATTHHSQAFDTEPRVAVLPE